MTWLIVYAVIVTIAAAWCGIGWWLAHSTLRELGDVDVESWPTVRALIRQKIDPPSTRDDR